MSFSSTLSKIVRVYPTVISPIGKERIEFYLILLSADILALIVSFLIAVSCRIYISKIFHSLLPYSWSLALYTIQNFWWLFISVPIAFCYQRVYDRRLPFWDETREIIKALILAFFIIYALMAMKKVGTQISRLTIGFTLLSSIVLIPSIRYLVKTTLFKIPIFRRKALILGASQGAAELIRALKKEKYLGYEIVGILDDNPDNYGKYIENKKIYGPIKEVNKFVKFLKIESIFIAVPSFSSSQLSDLFAAVQGLVKEVCIIPEFRNFGMLNAEASTLFSEKLFLIKVQNNLKSSINCFIKRSFDIIVCIIILPILLPLFGIVSILIMLDSPGSPIFIHERIGKDGRKIKVYKFRSMYKNSQEILQKYLEKNPSAKQEWETYFKLKNDPRITRIGKFLRRTSLDELPQIFNVLKGEMSLVGPRPVTEEELRKYYGEFSSFYYMVRPGITGLWQVSGRNELAYEDRVKMDVWYVLNWSLWLDIILLIRTISVVLKKEGSY